MELRPILSGLKSYFVSHPDIVGTGGSTTARYCYSIWLRHLVKAHEAGLDLNRGTVAELGPGDSLGTGYAALLTGARHYRALDVVQHASARTNAAVLEGLIELFANRTGIPGPDEFPEVWPLLDSYAFPRHILTDALLGECLRPERIAAIRSCVAGLGAGAAGADGISIEYRVPWYDPSVVQEASVDWLFSQAVLEHVDDLDNTYRAMHRWLKPGGLMTHQIDFRSHSMTPAWNGHWEYPGPVWTLVKGRRSFLLNRQPCSAHEAFLRAHGFEILRQIRNERLDGLERDRLASPFRSMSREDATTSHAFFVAVRGR